MNEDQNSKENSDQFDNIPLRKVGKVSIVSIEGGLNEPAVVKDHTPPIGSQEEEERDGQVANSISYMMGSYSSEKNEAVEQRNSTTPTTIMKENIGHCEIQGNRQDSLYKNIRDSQRRNGIDIKKQKEEMRAIKPDGHVGFASLPDQVYRKAVKKGFEFTLMVVGESGLGKSTLVNSMFLTDIYSSKFPGDIPRVAKTLNVETHKVS